MNEKEWEQFFDLLQKISNGPDSWKEKSELVIEKAKENSAETSLFEFVSWYGGSFGEDDDDDDFEDSDVE